MSFAVNLPLFCVVGSLLCAVLSTLLPAKAAKWLTRALSSAVAVCSALVLAFVLRKKDGGGDDKE